MEPNYPALEPLFEIKLEYKESAPPVHWKVKSGNTLAVVREESKVLKSRVLFTGRCSSQYTKLPVSPIYSGLLPPKTGQRSTSIQWASLWFQTRKSHTFGRQRLGLVSRPMIKGIAGSTRSLGYGKANLIVNHTAIIIVFTQEASNPHLQTNSASIEFMNVKKDF